MRINENSKLKALSDIASIDLTLEFNEILYNILKITCEAMSAYSGTLMLTDEGDGQLRMVASYGLPHDYIERMYEAARNAGVPLMSSPSGVALETGNYYLVPNLFEEPRCKPWWNLSKELGFSSQIFTPMKTRLKVIGLLNVYMAQVHQFTDDEINFVTIAASQASSVVQNAKLCIRLKDNFQELNLYKGHLEEKIKEAYKELYQSEAKHRELFENAQDAIYVLDTEGYFLKMNQIGLRILGCPKEEVIGSNISKWLTQDSLKIVEDRRKKRRSGEIVNQTDILELVCKNDEHRWVEIKTRPIKDGNRTIETHGIARDITENIRLKQELKKSNKQRKLLCYLIQGTRGGKTRASILKYLIDRSYNAHQLAKALNMDYKTIRHHLDVLVQHGIITRDNDGYIDLYFLSKDIELNLNEYDGELENNKI
jgi:PAS domain S-box-containing protein